MSQVLKDVIENTKEIFLSDSALDTLLDFERVVAELDTYVFKNWKLGELVSGPVHEKYFVTCTFMWPYKKMPDPRGGERLLDYGCEISYRNDVLEYPVKVKSYDDFEPGGKMPKMQHSKVWLVEIVMPKQLMSEIKQGSVEIEGEKLDIDEIETAYDEGVDEEELENQEQGQGQMPAQDMSQQQQPQPQQMPGGM